MDAATARYPRQTPGESPTKTVWKLAWPAVALNSLQIVNNLLDASFVGRLDRAAMTAHGSSVVVLFLMFSFVMALGTAATALVSRAFGAGDRPTVRRACCQCLTIALFSGFFFGAVSLGLSHLAPSFFLPRSDSGAQQQLRQYLLLYSVSLPALFLIQTLAGALRGVGDTRSPMVISGIQIVLHIAFNYLLIFPPRSTSLGVVIPGADMGLPGAGLAFTFSAWIAAGIYLYFSQHTDFGPLWNFERPSWEWAKRIGRIAWPAAFQGVVRVGSLGAFVKVLSSVPNASDAIAAIRFGFTLESIMFMPAFGLSVAAAALVGQSLGMKDPDRANRLAWAAGHQSAFLILGLCLPIYLGAPWIAGFLVGDAKVAAEVVFLIQSLCLTEVLFGYSMVMLGAMQGAGDTMRPFWIALISLWGMRVPMAWILSHNLAWGSSGAWIALSVTQAIQGLMSIWVFQRGAWKLKEV